MMPPAKEGMDIPMPSRLILILCALLLVSVLTIAVLIGIITNRDATGQHSRDLANIQSVLSPFMKQYTTQYDALNTDRSRLQSELDKAKVSLADAQKSINVAQVKAGDLESRNQQFVTEVYNLKVSLQSATNERAAEVGNLKAALQNAANDRAAFEKKFLQSQNTLFETQGLMAKLQTSQDELNAKLTKVNARTDPTVALSPTADQVTFYKVWDTWWLIWH